MEQDLPKEEVKAAPPKRRRRKRVIIWFTVAFLLLGLAWLLLWIFYLRFHARTNDAYANGNLVNINPPVAGSVIAFFADDTDLVTEGMLLVQLDPTYYQVEYEKALATLASTVLQVRGIFDTALSNNVIVENKRVALAKAEFDYNNRHKLVGSGAVSNEDFVHAEDALFSAELDLKQAEIEWHVSLDAVGFTMVDRHPLVEEQKANVRAAYYNLQHCSIYAPTTGYVAQRSVNVGEWVTHRTNLLAVIPTDYAWVDANFKETQLKNMRIGQPATVWFDLYGRRVKYEGEVLGIASGTGSVFSVIPPQNATGNWIKIVQRLPVRISLDPKTLSEYPSRLGLSAEVNVNTSKRDLPMLAQKPPVGPIAATNVFDIHLEKINQVIEEVIRQNLHDRPPEPPHD